MATAEARRGAGPVAVRSQKETEMPLPRGFDPIPGPAEPRFGPDRQPEPKKGPGEFARDARTAEAARAESRSIAEKLQAKTHRWVDGRLEEWPDGPKYAQPVQGSFEPKQFPGFGVGDGAETVWLEGGPLSDRAVKIRRGSATHTSTAANAVPEGNAFVPADYVRTKRLSNESLVIFEFQPAAVV